MRAPLVQRAPVCAAAGVPLCAMPLVSTSSATATPVAAHSQLTSQTTWLAVRACARRRLRTCAASLRASAPAGAVAGPARVGGHCARSFTTKRLACQHDAPAGHMT